MHKRAIGVLCGIAGICLALYEIAFELPIATGLIMVDVRNPDGPGLICVYISPFEVALKSAVATILIIASVRLMRVP